MIYKKKKYLKNILEVLPGRTIVVTQLWQSVAWYYEDKWMTVVCNHQGFPED